MDFKGLAILLLVFGAAFIFTGGRLMRALDRLEVELNKKTCDEPAKEPEPEESDKTK